MRVYIAGPMRGREYYNFRAFDKAAKELQERGFDTISPADMDRLNGFDPFILSPNTNWDGWPTGFDLVACVQRDLCAVINADAIYMLSGWESSKGSRAEKAVAEWMGHKIMYENA